MAFYPARSADWDVVYPRKRASVAFTANSLVTEHTDDDTVTPATSSSAKVLGIMQKKVVSTDSDYASNTRVPVLVPKSRASDFICDTVGGTIAVTDEGEMMDLTDENTVDSTASTTKIVRLKTYISATKGIFTLNKPSIV